MFKMRKFMAVFMLVVLVSNTFLALDVSNAAYDQIKSDQEMDVKIGDEWNITCQPDEEISIEDDINNSDSSDDNFEEVLIDTNIGDVRDINSQPDEEMSNPIEIEDDINNPDSSDNNFENVDEVLEEQLVEEDNDNTTSIELSENVALMSVDFDGIGDLNGDDRVNSIDYVLLRRYVLEIINTFPV
ncbi:UNVERIFIED_CONTAM: dockerin type I repeat protein [Acetivibrio alkalicellulosi]